MFRILAREVAHAARPLARGIAETDRIIPSTEELARTREFLNLVDDRLAASTKGFTEAIGRVEIQVARLEGKIERLQEKMDTFATKESVTKSIDKSIDMMETRLKNYLLVGAGGLALTGVTTAVTMAARVGFFNPEKISQRAEAPATQDYPQPRIEA